MASVINTNMASLYAQKNLSGAQNALSTSVERLSSGLRINRAKDDAAGLGISEKIASQIRALNQSVRNANDAVSVVQTAEGSLSEVSTILQRMKELTVQGANESLSTQQKKYIGDELLQLQKEVNAISDRTRFNGMSLLKNALRTQAASGVGALQNGSSLISNLVVSNLSVEAADVGQYSISTRTTSSLNAASVVNSAVLTAETMGRFTNRNVFINAGDVYEGAKITLSIGSGESAVNYSVVVGRNDSAATVATNLVSKISKDYASGVSNSNTSQITFDDALELGTTEIRISKSDLVEDGPVAMMRSTVDAPYTTSNVERTISINDYDVIEGQKFTVRVGNPTTVTEVSVIAGAADDKNTIANSLRSMLMDHFGASGSGGAIEGTNNLVRFAGASGYGQAKIELEISNTKDSGAAFTLSSVNDPYGVTTDRTITINKADLEVGRVISLKVAGKEYSYKVTDEDIDAADTEATVAQKLSNLLSADFTTTEGIVVAPGGAGTPTVNVGAGNMGAASYETAGITFQSMAAGDVVQVLGISFTASQNLTANEVAQAFENIAAGAVAAAIASPTNAYGVYGTYSGTLSSDWSLTSRSNAVITAQANTTGNVTDLNASNVSVTTLPAGTTLSRSNDVQSSQSRINAAPGLSENYTIVFGALNTGEWTQITAANGISLRLTATANMSADQVATAFDNIFNGIPPGGSFTQIGSEPGSYTSTRTGATLTLVGAASTPQHDLSSTGSAGNAANITKSQEGSDVIRETFSLNSVIGGAPALSLNAGDSISFNGRRLVAREAMNATDIAAAYIDAATAKGYFTSNFDATWTLHNTSSKVTNTLVFERVATNTSAWSIGNSLSMTINNRQGVVAPAVTGASANGADAYLNGVSSSEQSLVTFGTGLAIGDSVTIGGLRFTATSAVSKEQLAAAFANLYDGSTSGAGVAYGRYEGQIRGFGSGVASLNNTNYEVTFSATRAGVNVNDLTGSAQKLERQLSVGSGASSNVITLTGIGAKLGTADIDLDLMTVSNAGVITVTAGLGTGKEGQSQSIDLGAVSAGAFKNLYFDSLGVSMTLNNTGSTAIGAADFELETSGINKLDIAAEGDGTAAFQVGSSTQDMVLVDGFKDIRIKSANRNEGQEGVVFKDLAADLALLASGDVSTTRFTSLENRIESAITTISSFRSYLGAQQNRIDHAISNIQAQSENLTEANSRIRDTDYAAETANLTKTQIMQQAATAMLAQANQMPNVILALLK